MYIDIHTHKTTHPPEVYAVINAYPDRFLPENGKRYTCGIHPWHLPNWESKLLLLKEHIEKGKLIAVGECGLDKYTGNVTLQESAFRAQIELSETYQLPLIIHCVKMHNEIIRIRKSMAITQAWIFHGYMAPPETTLQLLKTENLYFAFGEALMRNPSTAVTSLKQIPLNRIFFETDESNFPVDVIYQLASVHLNLSETILLQQIEQNFAACFTKKKGSPSSGPLTS